MIDHCGREIDYLRISITDRCNLRCIYCMPEAGVCTMAHEEVLSYEEIVRVTRLMAALGIRHIRITGGEPMARMGCLDLIGKIHAVGGIETISMTTNGLMLRGRMEQAKAMGLTALNISLDTADPQTYRTMTRGGDVRDVLETIDQALACGLKVKINAVPVRGYNDEQLADLAAMARTRPISVRFIELMPVGCGSFRSQRGRSPDSQRQSQCQSGNDFLHVETPWSGETAKTFRLPRHRQPMPSGSGASLDSP